MINLISAFLSLFNVNYFLGFIKNGVFPLKLDENEENEYVKKLFIKEEHDEAREKLIVHNLRLVAHIANKYESKDENVEDLISIGTIGLIKAIDTFSPDKDVKIATYAAKCIENEILMVLRSNKKLSKNVSLLDSIGSDKDGSDITLLDVIPSSERLVEEEYEHNLDLNKLKSYLHVLDERETMIINLRYGLNGNKELTQKEISKLYKISRSYVSRIEKRALVKLLSEFKRNS